MRVSSIFTLKLSLACFGDVSRGGVSGNGPSQNSVLMLSSESFRFMVPNCVGSGSFVVVDKRRSGSAKIGMMKVEVGRERPKDCVVELLLFQRCM